MRQLQQGRRRPSRDRGPRGRPAPKRPRTRPFPCGPPWPRPRARARARAPRDAPAPPRAAGAREASVPTSSSGVRRSETAGGPRRASEVPSTAMATAIPAFMSKTPAPARGRPRRGRDLGQVPWATRCRGGPAAACRPPSPTAASTASPRGGHARVSARTPEARALRPRNEPGRSPPRRRPTGSRGDQGLQIVEQARPGHDGRS